METDLTLAEQAMEKVLVRAVPNIERCTLIRPKKEGDEPHLVVQGLNFDAFYPYQDIMDVNNIETNHSYALRSKYGVEAMRANIVKEVQMVFGVYGISAHVIAQRRREIGLRLALGARRTNVVRLMLRRGLVAPLVGMGIGLGLALALSVGLSQVLAGVRPGDPLTFLAVGVALVGVAGTAILIPASAAARVDPISTLRED